MNEALHEDVKKRVQRLTKVRYAAQEEQSRAELTSFQLMRSDDYKKYIGADLAMTVAGNHVYRTPQLTRREI
jgi:hypothetical protein